MNRDQKIEKMVKEIRNYEEITLNKDKIIEEQKKQI